VINIFAFLRLTNPSQSLCLSFVSFYRNTCEVTTPLLRSLQFDRDISASECYYVNKDLIIEQYNHVLNSTELVEITYCLNLHHEWPTSIFSVAFLHLYTNTQ